ncbi:MAG: ATP-binding cassette domain-containing protein [Pyrinomonadaceae bacterium]|nr:ATP-binding cassette domain-containing protein [Pyrinomonadaceae bacterium]
MTVAINVENLSKAYQIGQIGTGTISRDLERWFVTKVMGREDPFLKLGQVNDRTTKGETNVVWSLKDINLEIEQGDAVGIIGRNGAGKSTLLKLLSRVTAPTTGRIKIKGRVASLLEVGTGFHPELTGRENIYLNGSILGMRKREIDRKLDEIVDFSGVERYIDTPVKRYSSGMSVRLAFAVAAHLESEILIVDEVLAVGDADFQKKCLGKMEEVGKRYGRTILFVSHNMSAVQQLCRRGIQIDMGMVVYDGSINGCVGNYLGFNRSLESVGSLNQPIVLGNLMINGSSTPSVGNGEPCVISLDVKFKNVENPHMFFIVENALGQTVVHISVQSESLGLKSMDGTFVLKAQLPPLWLSPGLYSIYSKFLAGSLGRHGRVHSDRLMLEVKGEFDRTGKTLLTPSVEWKMENLKIGESITELRDSAVSISANSV